MAVLAGCIASVPSAAADGQPPENPGSPTARASSGWTVAENKAAAVAALDGRPGASAALAALSELEKIKRVTAGEPVLVDPTTNAEVTLTRRLDAPVPASSQAALASYDADHDAWTAVPTRLSADRTTLTATVDRSSYWTDLLDDAGIGAAAVPAPDCPLNPPTWLTPAGIVLPDDENAPLRWCLGRDSDDPALLVVTVRVNRGYGVALTPRVTPARVSDSLFPGGPEDVVVGVMTGALRLPSDFGRGVLLLPGGAEAVLTFTEDAVRSAGGEPLIRVEPAPEYMVAGLTYTALIELDPDGDRRAAMLAALVGVARCGRSTTRSVSAHDALGAARSATKCLDRRADEVTDGLATTLVRVRPADDPRAVGAAAGRAGTRLRQVWAAGLTFGVTTWFTDRRLPPAAWAVQVSPGKSRAVRVRDLLIAPVPALCRHAAGRLRNGELPNTGDGGYGVLALGEPDLGPVFADLTGDGLGDAAVVFRCSAGGVAWPDSVLFYGPGPRLLGVADLSTVLPADAEHATVSSIAADGTDVVVRWTTTTGCCWNPMSFTARLRWDGRAVRILGAGRA